MPSYAPADVCPVKNCSGLHLIVLRSCRPSKAGCAGLYICRMLTWPGVTNAQMGFTVGAGQCAATVHRPVKLARCTPTAQ